MPSFGFPNNGGAGPSGKAIAVNPARVIYVQPQAWPGGSDPNKYVNTIAQAMAKAAALVPAPSPTDPVVVYVYPGTYPGAFTWLPWVGIKGVELIAPIISGLWTFAPTGAGDESTEGENLRLENLGTLDPTGKTGGSTTFLLIDCLYTSITGTGRGPGADAFLISNGLGIGGGTVDLTDYQLIDTGGLGSNVLLRGTSAQIGLAKAYIGEFHTFDTASATASECSFLGPVESENGTSITAPSCAFFSTLTSHATGLIDARGSEILGGSGALVGPGPIDRTLTTMAFGPTAVGANLVAFAVPYPNANYNVSVTENAGAGGGAWPSVTLKNPTDFTLNDPTGARTFDITVEKE